MKTRLSWLIPTTLSIVLCSCAEPAVDIDSPTVDTDAITSISPDESPLVPRLGTGWDSATREYKTQCLKGASLPLMNEHKGHVVLTTTRDQASSIEKLGVSAVGKARYALLSTSMRAEAARSLTASSSSHAWALFAEYVGDGEILDTDNLQLTETGKSALAENEWRRHCGDEFVQHIEKGMMLVLILRMDFATEDDKRKLNAKVDLKGIGIGQLDTELKAYKGILAKSASLHIEAYQFGGDTRKLPIALTGTTGTPQEKRDATRYIANCSMNDLAGCDAVVQNAIAYATGSGPDSFVSQRDVYLNPLHYVTSTVPSNIAPVQELDLPSDISVSRTRLDKLFDDTISDYQRVSTGINNNWVHYDELTRAQRIQSQLSHRLLEIKNVSHLCYEGLRTETMNGSRHFKQSAIHACVLGVEALEAQPVELPENFGVSPVQLKFREALHGEYCENLPDYPPTLETVGPFLCGSSASLACCITDREHGTHFNLSIEIYQRWKQSVHRLGAPISNVARDRNDSGNFVTFENGILHEGKTGVFFTSKRLFQMWQSLPSKWLSEIQVYPLADATECGNHNHKQRFYPRCEMATGEVSGVVICNAKGHLYFAIGYPNWLFKKDSHRPNRTFTDAEVCDWDLDIPTSDDNLDYNFELQ